MRHDRAVARANLDLVLGETIARKHKRRMVRNTFRQAGSVITGLLWSPRLTRERAMKALDGEQFWKVLRELESRGKGAVLVTAHYGDWELLCHATGAVGLPVMMVTEPLGNPRLDVMFNRLRSCTGNTTVPPMYAMLKLFRALRRGQRVALMCDVNGRRGRGGVWIDFFGRKVFNGGALAELAIRTNSAVVFAVTIPKPDGSFKVDCFPPIEPTTSEDHAADVQRLTQQVVDLHAQVLQRDPEPWLWSYKRWKRRPSEAAEGYPFYSRYARVE
jgi:KDO2-lipid IV(A) lauroyltransferase